LEVLLAPTPDAPENATMLMSWWYSAVESVCVPVMAAFVSVLAEVAVHTSLVPR